MLCGDKTENPCRWDDAGNFCSGLAKVKLDNKWGFIDKTGSIVIRCGWDQVHDFREELARVSRYGKWGFIDKTGHVVA